ncbi:aminoacyl-tRNA deacylase [uncultured Dysosmobacter sp.]|uniref:aminoacyl-tRNA deacylase n=1 Tax=uncultured Dysosmobacter sp. TaxID=2591384 RepID=UPI0026033FFF|nr:YbaK/EbsC family protein [uncultured Dysosmobacter sp.]
MMTLEALDRYLREQRADYELIRQDSPILATQDAARHFDLQYAAPTLVLQTETGLMSLIVSAQRGRVNFEALKARLGLSKLKLADRKKAEKATGYPAGAIPLVGSGLPCVFDARLLDFAYIYGGSGDPLHTLKISPRDVERLNAVVFRLG